MNVNIYNNNNKEDIYSSECYIEDIDVNSESDVKCVVEKGISSFNFLKFIEIYPKKVDQMKMQKAYQIWLSDKLDMKVNQLFTYIQERLTHGEWQLLIDKGNERYIPDPATFLRDKMYEKDFDRVMSMEDKVKQKVDDYLQNND
jgi:hypothetical protein